MSLKTFLQSKSGATAIEYGLIAALVALLITASLILLGSSFSTPMETISDTLTSRSQSSGN
ncbi:Flp family type IVb pilin [Pseudochrobactrum sp. sp1633]|uniref:Flp family type IVb pilin n=1 Tax=Pseudochrobactrum sp. sp1633 TaxID=3036706 RepID=UPI0025A57CC0|nr:Flp family type IVb pilin [Pseudochrobactrum sp. sp1633]MDM8344615.1 Flp family type IVb pilin [Pseudochrobactrum sp. sp1633]HWD13625.1 Flp family type IVb pilin [Pseudochrobactrum sp.]